MKICIFGAASAHIDNCYIKAVEALGKKLAERGHTLVFGAGATGLMGAAARGFTAGGGKIIGVIPEFFRDEQVEQIYPDCTTLIYTKTMSERKQRMEDEAEAFIIVPGGIGTFEEFFEVLTLKQLGRHSKAIAVYNLENYYDELEEFMKTVAERKFMNYSCSHIYAYFHSEDELVEYVENYRYTGENWHKLKIGD